MDIMIYKVTYMHAAANTSKCMQEMSYALLEQGDPHQHKNDYGLL